MDCRQTRPLLEVFVDGELSPEQTLALEAHVEGCGQCAEQLRLLEAIKVSTRRAVLDEAEVSDAFRARLQAAMLAEREREVGLSLASPVSPRKPFPSSLKALSKVALPLAAAAALFLWLQDDPTTETEAPSQDLVDEPKVVNVDQALDRLIDYHSAPPPAEVTEADLLPTFERNVGVRVRAPRLDKFGASWEGANLVSMRNSQAASLRYRMPGKRFTVYVYDPRKVPVHRSLERRMVHDHPVYVGEWRGYTVAAKENRGIGYAMASDLDDVMTTELLTEIH